MTISYGQFDMLTRFVWESANFASGGGTTNLAWRTEAEDQVDAQAAAEGVRQAWQTHLRGVMDTDITLVEVQWETESFSGSAPSNLPGLSNLVCPPPNSALLATYQAAGKGRRNRGRNFWPGCVSETSVDERGVVTPAVVNAFTVALDAFFVAALALPYILGQSIAQSTTPGQATPPINPWPVVTTRVVQPVMATQRRRLRR